MPDFINLMFFIILIVIVFLLLILVLLIVLYKKWKDVNSDSKRNLHRSDDSELDVERLRSNTETDQHSKQPLLTYDSETEPRNRKQTYYHSNEDGSQGQITDLGGGTQGIQETEDHANNSVGQVISVEDTGQSYLVVDPAATKTRASERNNIGSLEKHNVRRVQGIEQHQDIQVEIMNNDEDIERTQLKYNQINENDVQETHQEENSAIESAEFIQNKESESVEDPETNDKLENQGRVINNDEDNDNVAQLKYQGENGAVENDVHIVKDIQNDDKQQNITGNNQEVLKRSQSLKRVREEDKELVEISKKGKPDQDQIIKDLEDLIKDSEIAGDSNHCTKLYDRVQLLEGKIQNIQLDNLENEKERLQQLKEKLNKRRQAFASFEPEINEVLEYERKLHGFTKSVEDFDGDNSDTEYYNLEDSLRKGFLYLKTLNTKEVPEEYNNKKIECMKTLRKLREKLINKTNITLNTDEEKFDHYTKKIKKVISKAEKLQKELDKLEGDEHYFKETLNKYMEEVDKIDFEPVRENKREAIRAIKKVYESFMEKVNANYFPKQDSNDDDI